MDRDPGNAAAAAMEERFRWPDADRRTTGERRRSAQGWFEMRARREGVQGDRRQPTPRSVGWVRALLMFRRRQDKT